MLFEVICCRVVCVVILIDLNTLLYVWLVFPHIDVFSESIDTVELLLQNLLSWISIIVDYMKGETS